MAVFLTLMLYPDMAMKPVDEENADGGRGVGRAGIGLRRRPPRRRGCRALAPMAHRRPDRATVRRSDSGQTPLVQLGADIPRADCGACPRVIA